MPNDYVDISRSMKMDSVMKPNKVQPFDEESYDFAPNKLIGGQPDEAAE